MADRVGAAPAAAVIAGAVLVAWQATTTLTTTDIAAAVALLSDEERARFGAMRFSDAARDYAAAHALLRRMLSRRRATPPRDWQFGRHSGGKPFVIVDSLPAPSFSISHARGMVACAVAPDDVGVDVEATQREIDVARIAARFFSPQESADLNRLDAEEKRERFFELWTSKEAMVKARGGTLATSARELAFDIDASGTRRSVKLAASAGIDADCWQVALFTPAAGYQAALTARHDTGRPWPITIVNAADLPS
jgi:4'-phosphopantetheinyl transferase